MFSEIAPVKLLGLKYGFLFSGILFLIILSLDLSIGSEINDILVICVSKSSEMASPFKYFCNLVFRSVTKPDVF